MDDFDKIMESVEREGAKVSQGLAKMLLDMWKNASDDLKKSIKISRQLSVIAVIASVLAIISIAGCIYLQKEVQMQAGEISAIQEILDSGVVIEEQTTTTTTTTSVEQDTGEGSGNNIYQAGENSSYTQNGGDE